MPSSIPLCIPFLNKELLYDHLFRVHDHTFTWMLSSVGLKDVLAAAALTEVAK